MTTTREEEIEIIASAMQKSKAWPAVFQAGTARALAEAAMNALDRHYEGVADKRLRPN